MTAFILSLIIVGSILLLFKLLLPEPRKTKKKRLARKVRQSAALARRVPEKKLTEVEKIKEKGPNPENPTHMRIFADVITKRNPDLTADVVKKWLREK